MHAFTDEAEPPRTWQIIIDPHTIEKVRARLGVNLYDLGEAIEQLFSDPPKFFHALYLLCDDQTDGKVSERDFCRGLIGDAPEAARDAFLEEMVFFSPKATKETLRRALTTQKKLASKTVEKLQARAKEQLDLADGEIDSIAEGMAKRLESLSLNR